MQKPANFELSMYQGATWEYELTWKISDVAVDLTGYTARMQVRSSYDSPTAILSITTGSGITLGGVAGTVSLTLDATATAAITAQVALYDLELVSPSGVVTRLLEGKFTITPEVTK